jgi:hypothetical protein
MLETTFIGGLDLGQAKDYTALAVLQRITPAAGTATPAAKRERRYAVCHLERFPLGTPYPAVCDRIVKLFSDAPLAGGTLAVDQTGVGRAVVDMLRRARPSAAIRPITITAGREIVPDGTGWHVPKKELVSVLQVLLQSRRLQILRTLPDAAVLVRELETFKVRITASANETFEAWREGQHDDMVLALGVACWVGEHGLRRMQVWC